MTLSSFRDVSSFIALSSFRTVSSFMTLSSCRVLSSFMTLYSFKDVSIFRDLPSFRLYLVFKDVSSFFRGAFSYSAKGRWPNGRGQAALRISQETPLWPKTVGARYKKRIAPTIRAVKSENVSISRIGQ